MADSAQNTNDDPVQGGFQAMYNAGGHFKEQLEAIGKSFKETETQRYKETEIREVQEIPVHPEVAPEVEGYIEKVEKEHTLPAGLADDYVRTVGMQSATPQSVSVKLPLSQGQIQQGLHHQVWEAIRWLAVWCLRQLQILNSKSESRNNFQNSNLRN